MKALVFLVAAVMTLTGCGGSSSSPAVAPDTSNVDFGLL